MMCNCVPADEVLHTSQHCGSKQMLTMVLIDLQIYLTLAASVKKFNFRKCRLNRLRTCSNKKIMYYP